MKVSENPKCLGCPLRERQPDALFVAPKFPSSNDLNRLVIGNMPTKEETEPFGGGAGRVLKRLFGRIPWSGLTALNIIQCAPPGGVFPTDPGSSVRGIGLKAVHHCIQHNVLPVLESREWNRVDLIGDKPLRFLGLKSGIGTLRGSPLTIDTEEIRKTL